MSKEGSAISERSEGIEGAAPWSLSPTKEGS
jgi:hypothetical protein